MTASEKRVAIAQDVISQLKAGKYDPSHCYVGSGFQPPTMEGDFKEFVEDFIGDNCEVCAIGSLFLSKVRLYNNVPMMKLIEGFEDDYEYEYEFIIGQDTIHEALNGIFSERQLYMMEAAYEQTDCMVSNHAIYASIKEDIIRSIQFGRQHHSDSDSDCMMAIMENIVQNNGEFIP